MNIFSYGSLMFPEVMKALTEKSFLSEKIDLPGFERRAILNKPYPGLIEQQGKRAQGKLYFDIDDPSLAILDAFEDEMYERRSIKLDSSQRGLVEARVYLVPPVLISTLSQGDWDKDFFEKNDLREYVLMCQRFRSEIVERKGLRTS